MLAYKNFARINYLRYILQKEKMLRIFLCADSVRVSKNILEKGSAAHFANVFKERGKQEREMRRHERKKTR